MVDVGYIRFGIVSEAKPGFAKVWFSADNLVSIWLPVLMKTSLKDKESWVLNVQEHVVCLTDKNCEEGVVLGCIASDADPVESGANAGKFRKVFEDGTVLEYDKNSHKLTANIAGSAEITTTETIKAISQTSIHATALISAIIESPDIQLKGNVTVLGTVTAASINAAPMSDVPGSTGKITANADIETTGQIKAADVVAGSVSLSTHTHSGVQTGSGISGPPIV